MCVKLGKLAVQGKIREGIFDHRVGQSELLLHKMNAQHSLQYHWMYAISTLG